MYQYKTNLLVVLPFNTPFRAGSFCPSQLLLSQGGMGQSKKTAPERSPAAERNELGMLPSALLHPDPAPVKHISPVIGRWFSRA